MSPVKARVLDFSNVKEGSGISPKHVEEGDYAARCVGVTEQPSSKDKTPMWVFTFTPDEYRSATYPEYVKLEENSLWKLRNIFIAAGLGKLVSGKKALKIDPNLVVGKRIGISLVDDEYEGKMKSTIEAFIPISELEESEVDEPEAAEVEDDEDEEEVEPAPKKKRKAAPVVEEEDDEDEDEEDEEPAPKPVSKRTAARRAAKAAAAVEEEDDDEEEEEEAPPVKKTKKAKKKAAPVVEEDEDDDLDIDLDDDDED